MKYIILLFLIPFFSLFPTNSTYASGPFIKFKNNPIEIFIENVSAPILQSHITYKEGWLNGLFSVNTNGLYRIVQASSIDGVSWNYQSTLRASSQNLYAPKFVSVNGETGIIFTKDDDKLKIYYSKCQSDLTCDGEAKTILEPNPSSWDSRHVAGGEIVKYKDIYYLIYEGFSGAWSVGLAYSTDGINWERCSPNPVFSDGGGVDAEVVGDTVTVYFHSSSGVESISTKNISCASTWIDRRKILLKDKSYDSEQIISPSIINFDKYIFLYYTGRGVNSPWSFNLASFPEYIPTQVSPGKTPIFFIPGMFASWNKEAILHNTPESIEKWKLTSFVKEYDGIIGTFKKYGYNEDNFIVVPYDWRKSLNNSVADISEYIKKKNGELNSDKAYVIGHSLGGLIGRIITQTAPTEITKMVSIAAPHKGVIQAYKASLTGEADRDDTLMWLAGRVILQLNSDYSTSKVKNFNRYMPVINDLVPTFDFLVNSNGKIIQPSKINTYLQSVNSSFEYNADKYVYLFGEKDYNSTPEYYRLDHSDNSKLFNRDKHEYRTIKGYGDYLVPSKSSNPFNTGIQLQLDHSEIIYSKEGIKQILRVLNIPIVESNIVSGNKTNITGSIFFFIQSPATFKVIDPKNNSFEETDGYVYIANPIKGKYTVEITGLSQGKYTIHIAQIGTKSERWDRLSSNISAGQSQILRLTINPYSPAPAFSKQHYKDMLCKYSTHDSKQIAKVITHICKNIEKHKLKDIEDVLEQLGQYNESNDTLDTLSQQAKDYFTANN